MRKWWVSKVRLNPQGLWVNIGTGSGNGGGGVADRERQSKVRLNPQGLEVDIATVSGNGGGGVADRQRLLVILPSGVIAYNLYHFMIKYIDI